MNQDLAFELTPAKARMLLKASELCLIDIDPIIEQTATQDMLAYSGPAIERSLAQFIIDTDFRCGVCGGFPRDTVLDILHILGVQKIIITGQNDEYWENVATFVPVEKLLTSEFQKTTRGHQIIFDWGVENNADNLEIIAKEYPKTIAYVSDRDTRIHKNRTFMTTATNEYSGGVTLFATDYNNKLLKELSIHTESVKDGALFPWWEIGCSLFPNMPRAIFDKSKVTFGRQVMHEPTWKKSDVDDIAMMYNVFLLEKMNNYGSYHERRIWF